MSILSIFREGDETDLKIIPIALNTFRESVRDRVLSHLVIFVLLLIVASIALGRIAYGQEKKVIIDAGLSIMTIFGVLIAIFLGVGLVAKEIEKRSIMTILSKPVRRSEFLIGKYLGLCLTLLINTAIMVVAITGALIYVSGGFDSAQFRLWPAAYMIFLELMIVTAVALLFSTFSSPALSAILTLLIFLIGRWSPDLKLIAETSNSYPARLSGRLLYHLLPNLANFNYINETAYGLSAPANLIIGNTIYAVFYIAAAAAAAVLIFERRNFR